MLNAIIDPKTTPPLNTKRTQWREIRQLLIKDDRIYVPENDEIKRRIVSVHHDTPAAEHPGQYNTMVAVAKMYYWPNMGRFIANYIKGCTDCQQMKVNTHPTIPPLTPIKTTHRD